MKKKRFSVEQIVVEHRFPRNCARSTRSFV